MRPFDLNKALAGEPVVSGNSYHPLTVRIICFNKKSSDNQTIVFLVENNGQEIITTCNKDGNNAWGHPVIFMAPVKRQAWTNVFETPSGAIFTSGGCYDSYEKAEKAVMGAKHYVKTMLIHEWEE